jgi:hypothetical protein
MNNIEPINEYTPTRVLAKQGVTAIGCIAGGVIVSLIGALPPLVSIAAGGIAGLLGIGALLSKDPGDKKPGIVLTAAGFLSIAAKVGIPALRPLSGTLLGLGAFGLFAMGMWNGFKFLKGLNNRR